MLPTGIQAPNFSLHTTPDHNLSLIELRGKRVILAFYPADWSPVCGDQMSLYNETLTFFQKRNAILLGISVDSKWCHLAFSEHRNLHFPLLADFEPKGEVARLYDVYDDVEGTSERTLYIIDENGKISWSYKSPPYTNPGVDGILTFLEQMDEIDNDIEFQR
jgi:peroxiredoxin